MVAEELNRTTSSTRPSSRCRAAWDQSIVQLQAAFVEFAEDGKSVKCLGCQKTFGKKVVITAIQNLYWGEGGPWKRHQDSATHFSAMKAHNSNKQLSLKQFFGPNKSPAAQIANMGRKKKTANLCWGLVPEPHWKHKLISIYHMYCIIGQKATYVMGKV
jgi:hypothetical protein